MLAELVDKLLLMAEDNKVFAEGLQEIMLREKPFPIRVQREINYVIGNALELEIHLKRLADAFGGMKEG